RALLLMFCALNGRTRTPRWAAQRQSAVASQLLPAPLEVPQTITLRVKGRSSLPAQGPRPRSSADRRACSRRAYIPSRPAGQPPTILVDSSLVPRQHGRHSRSGADRVAVFPLKAVEHPPRRSFGAQGACACPARGSASRCVVPPFSPL